MPICEYLVTYGCPEDYTMPLISFATLKFQVDAGTDVP